ncbi:MAG TPA: glutamyl-tRNA reductase [Blastocatellia bacterium]|jgi:glutamyl-tRNA reductase|nr:glutamyl-tRNA reductase [Blastocatellia bacterium]
MNIVLIGLSHRTAPVEMRERLAFAEAHLPTALSSLVDQNTVEEGLIVSTCNRVELLASSPGDPDKGIDRLRDFLCEFHHLEARTLNDCLYRHANSAAVKHVFRVASSLDSMVVGESQILGQVKEAYQSAIDAGTVGRVLSQLMHRAISVAKRVRTETGISQNPVSISSVAVELAKKIFGQLSNHTVLLVGAGEMAELAARKLMEDGKGKLIVTNRSGQRAEILAREFQGGAVNFEALYDVLPSADIVICSTGSSEYVIRPVETSCALKSRRKGPVLFIDISVPRNIDPAIADLDNAFLFDIDDLESVVQSNLREREREASAAEAIVDSEAQQFVETLRSLDIGPSVVEVKELISQLALAEFKRSRRRLGGLTAEQERAIQEVLIPALVNKLSHPVILHLRDAARNGEPAQVLDEFRKLLRLD